MPYRHCTVSTAPSRKERLPQDQTTYLFNEAMFDQPARRLGKEVNQDEDDQGRDQLDAHRCTPLRLALYKKEAIGNELAASNSKCLQPPLNHD